MKFEVYLDSQNLYRRRVVGNNNEKIGASSESFTSKQNAENNAQLVATGIIDHFFS